MIRVTHSRLAGTLYLDCLVSVWTEWEESSTDWPRAKWFGESFTLENMKSLQRKHFSYNYYEG